MDFIEDDAIPPMYEDGTVEHEDATDDVVELYGIPIYDMPEDFDPIAVCVIVKGYWGEEDAPALLYRTSSNLAPYEIQAMLTEGLRETF